ncbi:MAG: hypothetical protein O8C56_08725 [Candidatus Methanoperedens sp.]|nr:hypothetical protein [Candidatus Methanoperedens sp.]
MKLLTYERAEAEIVGHMIILGITVLGVSMIALYGVPSILSLQDTANLKNAEQTFTVLDSHASRAVLGDSPLQTTNINLGGAALTVEPNSTSPSYIKVNGGIFNFTMPMGKVEYQLGDRIVAYEGGGVWSKYPNGSVMISRPEFNYNGVTLSLPVFEINGAASVGGKGTAVVSFKKNPKNAVVVLFPIPGRIDQLTWMKQWYFNSSNESWVFTNTPLSVAGTVVGTNITTDGSPGSLSSSIDLQGNPGILDTSTTTWRSPNFTLSNGTPSSAVLNFSFSVAQFTGIGTSATNNYSVFLINDTGIKKQINQTTSFGGPTTWNNISNSSIDVTYFSNTGNYSLLLSANLSTADVAGPPHGIVEVHWDNPTITLNYLVNNVTYANRTNPVNYSQIGNVYVNITSDFYDAWADYIRSVSSTNIVSEDPKNHTVGMALTVYPSYDGIMNSYIPTTIAFRGLNGSNPTPLNNFNFRIYGKQTGRFLDSDIRATSGAKTLIFYITDTSNNINLTIGYQDSPSPVETWGTVIYTNHTDSKGKYIDVDLLNKSLYLNYSNKIPVGAYSSGCSNRLDQGSFNSTDFSWDNIIINTNNANTTQSLYNITQHYIQKMAQNGDFSFGQCSSVNNTPDLSDSTMYVNYYSPGGLIYLHITDNKADVGIS